MNSFPLLICLAAISASEPAPRTSPTGAQPASRLVGLWQAKRRFGPDVRGTLAIDRYQGNWQANIAGHTVPIKAQAGSVLPPGELFSFDLPDHLGSFKGRFAGASDAPSRTLTGHWIQYPRTEGGTAYATPVKLLAAGMDRWQGQVRPLDDEMTFYLLVTPRQDGSITAFLRNPEYNAGRFIPVDRIVEEADSVKLLGKTAAGKPAVVLAQGTYHDDILSLWLPSSGGTFDFTRVKSTDLCDFYPRGRPRAPYLYAPPRQENDGWPTASLEDVGLSRAEIERFMRILIDTPMDSIHAPQIHAVLIARHGKLVLEEYFHGEYGDKLHDTRSAAKSLTATLLGAAIRAGVPIEVSTTVYSTMNGGSLAADLDPRKRALTVEHLLTMSSGLDCDDSNERSLGNEDVMQEQTREPNWYRYTMALPMVRSPGERAVYGSANPNLLGGVLGRASGRWLPDLFRDLVAEPLGIDRYAMNLTPTGDAYMGGGVRFRPRDFMKLGQLMLDGGLWHGRAIVTPQWCRRAASPLYEMRGMHYGYLWWIVEYPYKGRTIRAFFAGGNGGQLVLGIPDLDLLIAFYGGSYSDRVSLRPQQEYVPKYILPAVQDAR
jgi:CubicO group peptidase (beta-lactamase class C family)